MQDIAPESHAEHNRSTRTAPTADARSRGGASWSTTTIHRQEGLPLRRS
jgi:hypothetical protein